MIPMHLLLGLTVGAVYAIIAALSISHLPAHYLLSTPHLLLIDATAALLGLLSALLTKRAVRGTSVRAFDFFAAGLAGAALFDGTAIVHYPTLYGQTGLALTHAAARLLFGLGSFGVAALVTLTEVPKIAA